MKKILCIICLLLLMFLSITNSLIDVCFADGGQENIEQELGEQTQSQLGELDLSALENILNDINDGEFDFFGKNSFKDMVNKIINGEFTGSASNVFSALINLVFEDILDMLPTLISIIAIAVLCSFVNAIKSNVSGKSVGDIVHFVCFSVIVALLIKTVVSMVALTTSTLTNIQSQMEAVFPIMLTLIASIGGTVSVSLFQPTVALLSSGIIAIFTKFVMPIFIFTLIFSIISNLSSSVRLNKFTSFFSSLFKYVIGFVLTIFTAFLSIQGITANSHDGVSFRTAKYAIKSYVPILGGYLSEGLDVILTSSVLIKNAVGVSGLLLLFATIVVPLIKIVVFGLCLKLTAAILEPIADSKTANFAMAVSKTVNMLVVMILGVAFMYLITLGILMATANFA